MKEILENFNDKSAQSTFEPEDVRRNNILVIICYVLPILFFLPIVVDSNSSYCRFHANQILTWFIFGVAFGVVLGILTIIPVIGAIIDVIAGLCLIAVLVALGYGAYEGMAVRIPFIGNLLNIF